MPFHCAGCFGRICNRCWSSICCPTDVYALVVCRASMPDLRHLAISRCCFVLGFRLPFINLPARSRCRLNSIPCLCCCRFLGIFGYIYRAWSVKNFLQNVLFLSLKQQFLKNLIFLFWCNILFYFFWMELGKITACIFVHRSRLLQGPRVRQRG